MSGGSPRTFTQYRAVAADAPEDPDATTLVGERGIPHARREQADSELEQILAQAQPPYDEGWIEKRTVTEWVRDDAYTLAPDNGSPSQSGGIIPINVAERSVLLEGLSKLSYGYAQDVAQKLEDTKCKPCRGTGFAPYVGGDDDEVPCPTCGGTGWRKNP